MSGTPGGSSPVEPDLSEAKLGGADLNGADLGEIVGD
jgi:hypothetical protein